MTDYNNHVEMNSDLVVTAKFSRDVQEFIYIPITGTDSGTAPPTYSSNPVVGDGGGGGGGGGGSSAPTGADAQSWSDSI